MGRKRLVNIPNIRFKPRFFKTPFFIVAVHRAPGPMDIDLKSLRLILVPCINQQKCISNEEVVMNERSGAVTMKGNPLTLLGNKLETGDKAPDVELLGNDLQPVRLSAFSGKVVIISSVPSLDTPVCDMETRRFNTEAANLGDDVAIAVISMDLPFAQARWCGAAGVDKLTTLSDHRSAAFGEAYGVLIKELRLLARSIFVVDRSGAIQYIQHVKEISEEPDYGAVIAAARNLL